MSARRFILILILAVIAGTGYYFYGGSTTPQGQPALTRLNAGNMASLKDAFNQSQSSVRVLLMLSPT